MTSRLHETTTEHFMVMMLRKFRNGLWTYVLRFANFRL